MVTKGKRGQSTLEYVIVLTAIIAVVIAFASTFLKQRVQSSLEHVATQMDDQVGRIQYK